MNAVPLAQNCTKKPFSKQDITMFKCTIIGNLGKDAVVKNSQFGEFVSLTIAHTEKYTDRQGVQREQTVWVSGTINWNASRLLPYLKKGVKVYAYGNLKQRIYVDGNGNHCISNDLNISDFALCGGDRPTEQKGDDAPF